MSATSVTLLVEISSLPSEIIIKERMSLLLPQFSIVLAEIDSEFKAKGKFNVQRLGRNETVISIFCKHII